MGGSFNLRYEHVDEDNALEHAEALTLRSALQYSTDSFKGWSALLEVEDVTIVGVDDYTVAATGFNPGRYSTIADPEVTELNQSYLQYTQGGFAARLGRQDLRYDNMRFIGSVPWRQHFKQDGVYAEADYFLLEGGLRFGALVAKLGYESLGSDDASYGFNTPLATLHLFQGWADVFLATPAEGLNDVYLSLALPVAGGNFTFAYHDYQADEASAAVNDLGDEFNLQWVRPFKDKYQFGLKYADYNQGDAAARVDKRLFWSWVQLSF